jgi:hypothetical protein
VCGGDVLVVEPEGSSYIARVQNDAERGGELCRVSQCYLQRSGDSFERLRPENPESSLRLQR